MKSSTGFFSKNLFFSGLTLLLLSGCSSIENSHRQKESMMSSYISGDNKAVLKKINNKLRTPAWYNSSVVNTGDELMWRLEAGSMNFHVGNFKESISQFQKAEKLIYEYDDRARISARDVSAEVGTAVTNLNTLPYRGFCRDRITLSIYKSLAYLGTGNESAFRAQVHRLRNEQKKVQDDYREFFDQEKARLAKEAKAHPNEAKQAQKKSSVKNVCNDPQNAEFSNAVKKTKEIAHKGYGNFLNPAAIFLSGLGSLLDENYSNACIDFKRLYQAMPKNPMIRKYYVTLLTKAGRNVPSDLRNTLPFEFPLERDCVYLLFANGRSAAFSQIAIYFPVMTAWPVCKFYDSRLTSLTVRANGKDYSTSPLADMDGILAQEYDERLPGLITRIVISTLIKDGAYYGGMATIASVPMDSGVRTALLCSVGITGALYRAAMNTADTRSWEILPKEFQLTQLPMPKDRTLLIEAQGNRIPPKKIRIPQSFKSAIVYVSAPSIHNVTYHIFPLPTK